MRARRRWQRPPPVQPANGSDPRMKEAAPGEMLALWIPALPTASAMAFEAVVVSMLGLVLGSYATLLSWRLPRDLPTMIARSNCRACGRALGPGDLVPLLSWAARAGRCGCGRERVSWRYPAIEATTLAVVLLAWLIAGFTLAGAALAALGMTMVAASAADFETLILPDELLIAAALAGLLWIGATAGWADVGAWVEAGIGALLGLALTWGVRAGYHRLRGREGLGLGDVKLFGVCGLWLGPWDLPLLMLASGVTGIILGLVYRVASRDGVFPFGPAIAAALVLLVALRHEMPGLQVLGQPLFLSS